MCGIVAVYSRREPISPATLERATKSLYHRGPDGQRQWISRDNRVGLGHARLSIIDLATGDQPIASEDDRTHIVANGEFYEYEAIQRELESRGHRLRTRSDSEIALHLYEELGPQCLHQLRGEFAFVIWDEKQQTLFAARDRFGIKPLFYAWHNDTLYIASEVKALFAAGVPARWDEESVYQSFTFGGHQMRTLYDGVHLVPPGHYLIATEKHFQITRYWDFNYPVASDAAPKRSRRRLCGGVSPRAGRGGAHPSARRCAGGRLSERRAGLVRGAGTGRAASSGSDSRIHADLRRCCLR